MAFNPLSPEWPKQTADAIDRVVQVIRRNFTSRAVTATNAIVFGLVAGFAAFVAALVGLIVGIRSVQAYLSWDLGTAAAWVIGVLALIGLLIALVGAVRSQKAALGLGAGILVWFGARWALDAGSTSIDHDTSVWISYFVVGGLFVLAGAFLMGQRHTPDES